MAAVLSVPEGYRQAALSLNVSRWEMFRHVLLPASLPQIFVGLRIAAGVSVLILVGVEFVVGVEGIGYLINQGRQVFLLSQAYVGIVLTALLGIVFTLVVRMAGRLVAPWAKEDNTPDQI
jgi:sulfonate transport system permease protein